MTSSPTSSIAISSVACSFSPFAPDLPRCSRTGTRRNFSERCVDGIRNPFVHEMRFLLSDSAGVINGDVGVADMTCTIACVSILWISIFPFGRRVVIYG